MDKELKNILKKNLFLVQKALARFKLHILPVHYYSPVPNLLELEKSIHVWAKKSELPGLETDLKKQLENLRRICLPFQKEYEGNRVYQCAETKALGPGYGFIEAQALHAVLRYFKPRRIVEVGSGASTWCMLNALETNKKETNVNYSLTCIEPYPSAGLKKAIQEKITLIAKPVQEIPFNGVFDMLGENDILFIDSSHTIKPGGDVNYIILEVLPRLKPGVIVHFHDIYLPYDYPRDVLETFFHGMETSLLRAFLINNKKARVLFCLSHLHYDSNEVIAQVFPDYQPLPDINGMNKSTGKLSLKQEQGHFPSSLYFQIK